MNTRFFMTIPNCSLGDNPRNWLWLCLHVFVFILVPISSSLCQVSWDGGGTTNSWMEEENWNGDELPSSTDNVFISAAGAVTLPTNSDVTINTIELSLGTQLTISTGAKLTTNSFAFQHENTKLFNNGILNIMGGNSYGISLGGFTHFENNGSTSIFNAGGVGAVRLFGATLINNNYLLIDGTTDRGDGIWIVNYQSTISSVTNNGTVIIRNTSGDGISGGGTYTNNGFTSINNVTEPEDLLLDGESGLEFKHESGAIFIGSGEIDPTTFYWNGGQLSPDDGNNSSDKLEFFCLGNCAGADFTNSFLMVNIWGTAGPGSAGGHDLIHVNENAHLGGSILISLDGNYTPQAGHSFEIMTYGSKTGPDPTLILPALSSGLFWEQNIGPTSITITVATVLPVELTSFVASQKQTTVLLEWESASENNNRGFHVQKSTDGQNWNSLGFVEGKGTSHSGNSYFFEDVQPQNGENYYRLKQEDFDGGWEYSKIVVANFRNDDSAPVLSLFPNPVGRGFPMKLDWPGDSENIQEAFVHDAAGRVVWSGSSIPTSGELDTYGMASGIYFFVLRTEREVLRERFVVR